MEVELLLVPYDSARRSERMGAGPEALIRAGLPERLAQRGHRVRQTVIETRADSWRAEIRTSFELATLLAEAVRGARAARRFPLVLAGNCGVASGVCAGLGSDVMVLWADAHGDFNTPETTIGGFLDGMALATLTGRCWSGMTARIPGFAPVPEERIWLHGARDLDPLEADALERSAIHRLPAQALDTHTVMKITDGAQRDASLYVHLDLDVLDASAGHANAFAVSGGLSVEALVASCRMLRQHAAPAAVTISAYDPATDVDRRVCDVALRAVEALFGDVSVS